MLLFHFEGARPLTAGAWPVSASAMVKLVRRALCLCVFTFACNRHFGWSKIVSVDIYFAAGRTLERAGVFGFLETNLNGAAAVVVAPQEIYIQWFDGEVQEICIQWFDGEVVHADHGLRLLEDSSVVVVRRVALFVTEMIGRASGPEVGADGAHGPDGAYAILAVRIADRVNEAPQVGQRVVLVARDAVQDGHDRILDEIGGGSAVEAVEHDVRPAEEVQEGVLGLEVVPKRLGHGGPGVVVPEDAVVKVHLDVVADRELVRDPADARRLARRETRPKANGPQNAIDDLILVHHAHVRPPFLLSGCFQSADVERRARLGRVVGLEGVRASDLRGPAGAKHLIPWVGVFLLTMGSATGAAKLGLKLLLRPDGPLVRTLDVADRTGVVVGVVREDGPAKTDVVPVLGVRRGLFMGERHDGLLMNHGPISGIVNVDLLRGLNRHGLCKAGDEPVVRVHVRDLVTGRVFVRFLRVRTEGETHRQHRKRDRQCENSRSFPSHVPHAPFTSFRAAPAN